MQIIWSDFAINNLKEIFDYYKTNVSLKIAHAIRKQILEATKQLQRFPESGSPEFYLEELQLNHRYLVINNFVPNYSSLDFSWLIHSFLIK